MAYVCLLIAKIFSCNANTCGITNCCSSFLMTRSHSRILISSSICRFIRPQAKKAKQQKTFIENLQKGDKIVTIAGIHGVVNKVNEDGTLQLEINPGSYIKIEKSAISLEWTNQLNKPVATTPTK